MSKSFKGVNADRSGGRQARRPARLRKSHEPRNQRVLTFAIGVAISPVPIIAVILMLFSERARVNGPLFLLGWVTALTIVSGVVYAIADQGNAATDRTAS